MRSQEERTPADDFEKQAMDIEAARTKLRRLREVLITIANYSDAAAHASRLAEGDHQETGRAAAYTDMTTKIRNVLSRSDVCP